MELAREVYVGLNDCHLTDKLMEVEKIEVSRETIRRLLRAAEAVGAQIPIASGTESAESGVGGAVPVGVRGHAGVHGRAPAGGR